jgi:chemotaxis protein methyltransferase CheR
VNVAMDLTPFKRIVKERCGLCFEEAKSVKLGDGIRARMSELGIAEDSDYLACLKRDEDEFHCLVNLLTINETYFFREPVHLDLLVNRLFPEMLASKKPHEPVRILHAGCSTGEEPYSLMMKLLEKYSKNIKERVSITGVDIDSDALKRAEKGIYSGLSFRCFPNALRKKYFESEVHDRYRIRDFVRDGVRFTEMNLMSEAYPDALHGMDAIYYRNVSIYFEPQTQRRIFDRLGGLLNENGWLFVSSTETLSHNNGSLSLVELDKVFCYKKGIEVSIGDRRHEALAGPAAREPLVKANTPAVVRTPVPAPPKAAGPEHRPVITVPKKAGIDTPRADHSLFDSALVLAKGKSYEEALRSIDLLLEQDPAFIKAYMLKAGILINMKQLVEAEKVCNRSLELDRWSLEGHLLLGLIAKLGNDIESALRRFNEALYIRSSCWLAHFYVAEILCSSGDGKNACREYKIVVKLLQKGDLADHGLTFFPLAFPVEQIMHLCQHNIAKLGQGKG